LPTQFDRASRIHDDGDEELFTHDIRTSIKCELLSDDCTPEEMITDGEIFHVDELFNRCPVKVKLTFSDSEGGYGGYGPYGGGMESTVFCGVDEFTDENLLELFNILWNCDADYFSI
jgi:hypothetical protein